MKTRSSKTKKSKSTSKPRKKKSDPKITIPATYHPDHPILDETFYNFCSGLRTCYKTFGYLGESVKYTTQSEGIGLELHLKYPRLSRRYDEAIVAKATSTYDGLAPYIIKGKGGKDICCGTREYLNNHRLQVEILKKQLEENIITRKEFDIQKSRLDTLLTAAKNHTIYSMAESSNGGNSTQNIVYNKESKKFFMSCQLLVPNEKLSNPRSHSDRSESFELWIPQKFHEFFKSKLYKYSMEIKNTWYEKGYYDVRITLDTEAVDYLDYPNKMGMDLNSHTIDITVTDSNLVKKVVESIPVDWLVSKAHKQRLLTGIIKNKLIPLAHKTKSSFVIENLSYFGATDKGKKSNRLINAIPRKLFRELLTSLAKKERIRVSPVEPRYTSHIAVKKYSNEFENKDRGASYVIARKKVLRHKWFENKYEDKKLALKMEEKYLEHNKCYDYYEKLPKKLKTLCLFIGILLNINRVLRGEDKKVKAKFWNRTLWYYSYHLSSRKKLKELMFLTNKLVEKYTKKSRNVATVSNVRTESIETITAQIDRILCCTTLLNDYRDLYEFLWKLRQNSVGEKTLIPGRSG
jgi:hypothetical protein